MNTTIRPIMVLGGINWEGKTDLHVFQRCMLGLRWRRQTGLSPPVKYFTDRSKAVLLLWIIYVISVLCLLCFRARLFIDALWSPAGKGLTPWLSFVMSNCEGFFSFLLYPGSGVVLDCIDS